jgi:hypothetical protein
MIKGDLTMEKDKKDCPPAATTDELKAREKADTAPDKPDKPDAKSSEDTKPRRPDHPTKPEDEDKEWTLPEGTTRATLPDGSIVYTLPDGTQRHEHLGVPANYIFKPDVSAVDPASAKDIAELIRDKFDPDYAQKVHPDEQHLHNTAVAVAKNLDVEPSALMINHISGLITQYVKRPSAEYPKMLYNHGKRQQQTVANRAEEDEFVRGGWVHHHWNAPKPERRRWRETEPVDQDEASQDKPPRE